MKTKYTLDELKNKIYIKVLNRQEYDRLMQWFESQDAVWIGGGEKPTEWISDEIDSGNLKIKYGNSSYCLDSDTRLFCNTNPDSDLNVISVAEFFLDDKPDPIPTEYAVLTNATESAKKQIAEFEQVLTQIKIDAMKLGSRDLARLIKALKEI